MSNEFKVLIKRYAGDKVICNCGEAYLTNCGKASIPNGHGGWNDVTDYPTCEYGCSANQITAKEFVAKEVINELENLKSA